MDRISSSTKIILIVEFIVLSYMLYVLSTSLYKSYQVDRFIQTVEDDNKKLETANAQLIEDFEYYSSDAYREKIAKQNFGLVRPGEEVIVLAPQTVSAVSDEERNAEVTQQYYRSISNSKKWFLFFFDRERFSL